MQTIKRATPSYRSCRRPVCGPVNASSQQLARLRKELGNRIGPAADTLVEILAVEPEVKRRDIEDFTERIIAQNIASKLELELLILKASAENREALAAAREDSREALAAAVLSNEKGIAAAILSNEKGIAAAILINEKGIAAAILSSEKATSKLAFQTQESVTSLQQRINILIAVVVVAAAFTSPIASSMLLKFVK